ncbi:MAG: RluA family pseudouridine synthase [Lactobacillus sp.]
MHSSQFKTHFIYPVRLAPVKVSDLLRQLLIPRKWRHYLRIEQAIKVNGKYRHFNELIVPGEQVTLQLNHVDSDQQNYPASGKLPQIVYEDANVLVINKPAGQKTHPNLYEHQTALNDCCTYLGYSPYVVHRIDMLTSGLLLVAKNPAVVPILNRQLSQKTFSRDYLAIVAKKQLPEKSGWINLPIGRDPQDRRKRMTRPDGAAASTHYQLLKTSGNEAMLAMVLRTGRTHQIRVHLAAIGCPIIGDPLYNPDYRSGQRLKLLATRMSFIKPFSFEQLVIQLPARQT